MTELIMLSLPSAVAAWPLIANVLDQHPELWEVTTKEDLRMRIESGEIQVWVLGDGAVGQCLFLTQILSYPAAKAFQVFFGAGEGLLENWEMILDTLRQAAREEECELIEIITMRTGLVQLFRSVGFRMREITLVERVEPARLH